jgi:hypothetical protein
MLFGHQAFADTCLDWFKQTKINPGPSCETQCMITKVGMNSFMCHDKCDVFCNPTPLVDKVLATFLYYPGLNKAERELVSQHPKEALFVFKAKAIAEWRSSQIFDRNDRNDESDAIRHYLWAANMQKDVGSDLAKKFLDAHESKDKGESKSMDLANNRAGLLAAELLQKQGKFTEEKIEQEALKELKEGTLIVVNPKGGPK